MTKIKIERVEGLQQVECPRENKFQEAFMCKGCKSLKAVDPVSAEILCREG